MMDLDSMSVFMAQAPAQPAPAPGAQPGMGDLLKGPMVPMLIMMAGLLYIMHRSQTKKAREHAELLKTVKTGDKILTSGGILATVITVKDKSATVRSADAKLEISKSAIAEIVERAGQP